MNKSLLCVGGTNHGKVIPIMVQEFRIGRDAMCHLRPASTDISRLHCAIVSHPDGRLFLRDYASSNGTIINHRYLIGGEYELKDGDYLEVGPLAFRFHCQDAAPTTLKTGTMITSSAPVQPERVAVPAPIVQAATPNLPGLTHVSSVPRPSIRDESALETTPDFLTESNIFCVHDEDLFRHDTQPNMKAIK